MMLNSPRLVTVLLLALGLALPAGRAQSEPGQIRSAIVQKAPEIMKVVEKIRGLEFKQEVPMDELSREKFKDFLVQMMEEELSAKELDDLTLSYKVLGLMPEDYDLVAGLLGLLGAGVMGYYDHDSKKLYVLADAPMSGYTELIIAHELLHALEDQHFDLGKRITAVEDIDNDDLVFATKGLIEGTASYLHELYLGEAGISVADLQVGMMEKVEEILALPEVPIFLMRDMNLPYTRGPAFIAHVAGPDADWSHVDRLFDEPPASGEQVLHPSRYGKDYPVAIELPDVPGFLDAGWRLVREGTLGELGIASMAETLEGKKENMIQAQMTKGFNRISTGWDGDRFGVYVNEELDRRAMVLMTVWDTEEDAMQFLEHYAEHGFEFKHPDSRVLEHPGLAGDYAQARDRAGMYHIERIDDLVVLVEGFEAEVTADLVTLLAQWSVTRDPRDQGVERAAASTDPLVWEDEEVGVRLRRPSEEWEVQDGSSMLQGFGKAINVLHAPSETLLTVSLIPSAATMPVDMIFPMLTERLKADDPDATVEDLGEREIAGIKGRAAVIASRDLTVQFFAVPKGSDLYLISIRKPGDLSADLARDLKGLVDSLVLIQG